jgi:hypothetical protein
MIKHFAYIAAVALALCSNAVFAVKSMDEQTAFARAMVDAKASVELKTDIYHSGVKVHTDIQVVHGGEAAQFVEVKPLSYAIAATPYLAQDGQILINVLIRWQITKGQKSAQPHHETNQYYSVARGESGKAGTPMDFKIDDIPVTLVITATKLESTGKAQ